MTVVAVPLAVAQSTGNMAPRENYIPHLGDIMGMTQLRHFKLWFSGKLRNWDLAAYELDQIKVSFNDAVLLYPGIPVTDMTIVADPVKRLQDAIDTKDGKKFDAAFMDLTNACNGCHRAIGRGFIVVRVPTASPFSNQSFGPSAKP